MRWTDSRLLAALDMRAAGRSEPEIAEAFGVPTSSVAEVLAKVDRELAESEQRRRKRKAPPPPMLGVKVDPEKFLEKFEEKFPGRGGRVQAAAYFGVTRRTVTRWLSGATTVPKRVAREIGV